MSTANTVGIRAFIILKECAQFVPIPLIGTAAEMAIRLLEISMEIKSNQEGFIEVGTMACETMKDIVERTDKRKHPDLELSERFKMDIEQLLKDLEYIQHKVATHSKKRKSTWKRIFYHVPDAEVVTQCKNKFEETTKRFNYKSLLEVRLTTDQINSQIERAVEKAQMAPALVMSAIQADMAYSASPPSASTSVLPLYSDTQYSSFSQSTSSSSSPPFPQTPPSDTPPASQCPRSNNNTNKNQTTNGFTQSHSPPPLILNNGTSWFHAASIADGAKVQITHIKGNQHITNAQKITNIEAGKGGHVQVINY